MNKHILLVMKWLDNPESVSQEELKANRKSAAYAAYYTADAAYRAAHNAYWAAYYTADADAVWDATDAQHWVDIYFERTGENKADYIKELK